MRFGRVLSNGKGNFAACSTDCAVSLRNAIYVSLLPCFPFQNWPARPHLTDEFCMQGDHDGEEDDEFEGAVPAAVASSPNLLRTGETEHKDDEAFHTPSCRDVVRDSGSSAASASRRGMERATRSRPTISGCYRSGSTTMITKRSSRSLSFS